MDTNNLYKYKIIDFIYLVLVVWLSFISCTSDTKRSENLASKKENISITWDTIKLNLGTTKVGDGPSFKISNTSIWNGKEILSISNFITQTIDFFDLREKKFIKSISLFTDGPDATITGKFGFLHQILPGNRILILDPFSRTFSILDQEGKKISAYPIPMDPYFDYISPVDYSIQGAFIGENYYYPAVPYKYMPEDKEDKNYQHLKHLFHFHTIDGFKPMAIDRNNYYTTKEVYYTEECCWANFVTSFNENLILSDCASPIIKVYGQDGNLRDTFVMQSAHFDHVPAYPKPLSNKILAAMSSQEYYDYIEFGHKSPSYRQLFIDTLNGLFIRQTKLGMSEAEYKNDRTKWGSGFILADIKSKQIIHEIKVNRGELYGVNFLDIFMTSEGLYMSIYQNDDMEEGYMYFLRMTISKG
jgi:hypothetical protein